jgi:hypothetical protein
MLPTVGPHGGVEFWRGVSPSFHISRRARPFSQHPILYFAKTIKTLDDFFPLFKEIVSREEYFFEGL